MQINKKSNHKLFHTALATTMVAGAVVSVVPSAVGAENAGAFTDVKSTDYFYEPIQSLTSRDIIKGYEDGTYRPYQSVTRAQAAKIIALALELDTKNVKNPGFTDVKTDDWHYGPIAALVEAGILKGYDDKTFKPNGTLTRAQMAKIITLGFKLKEEPLTNNPFADVKADDWYANYLQALLTNEITTGKTASSYAPNDAVTRGQMAAFVFRSEGSKVEQPPLFQYKTDRLKVSQIAQYDSGVGAGGTEILAYDEVRKLAFVTNGAKAGFDILSFEALESGKFQKVSSKKHVSLADFGIENVKDITSIASHPTKDLIAISAVSNPKTDNGHVVFTTKDGEYVTHVEVGALPDMVAFTPDGTKVIVANEGEPSGFPSGDEVSVYTADPEGSISVINVTSETNDFTVQTLHFDESLLDENVRVSSKGTILEQLEPEYVTVSDDSKRAYVSMQENNAVATIDLENLQIISVKGLGVKDHSVEGNELDVIKDDEKAVLENQPILAFYMPDAIDTFTANGKAYIVTPNEGDSRDYSDDEGYSEEADLKDILDKVDLNAEMYAGYTQEQLDAMDLSTIGDYKVTIENGLNEEGKYEAIYGYGGRSFSIFDAETMELVYDSGSDFERITAEALPEHFNIDNEELGIDDRSDNKGPEPETVVTGVIDGTTYAFIALERISGIMVYDLTNPTKPEFVTLISSRDFSEDIKGDVSPEGLQFIPAEVSPTGKALLAATHEVSGTVAVYEFH